MNDEWGKNLHKTSKEEEYFQKKNMEAIERLKLREDEKPRLSPITGEEMEHLTIMGVVVDRCPTSEGIWLDAGELEEIIMMVREEDEAQSEKLFEKFFDSVFGQKKK